MDTPVKIEHDEHGIWTVSLNRPERRNAFDASVISELQRAFDQVDQSQDARMLILRGSGKTFCAGADLDWMRRMARFSFDENLEDARKLAKMLYTLNALRVPTLALIQGAAFGGAVGLAACCDIVVAEGSAVFCLSETRLGLSPATISPYVIAAIGARQARRYFVTAEVISATRALEIGLAHEIAADGDLTGEAEKIKKAVLAGKPLAQRESKLLAAEEAYRRLDDVWIEQTSKCIAARRAHPEAQAAINAFLERK